MAFRVFEYAYAGQKAPPSGSNWRKN
jgi:hypothetical protein